MTPSAIFETRRKHNLPSQPTTFIGREAEIAEIVDLLAQPDCRLLTLVGPGGIGKTRLAVEVANRVEDGFPHSVTFVPLTPLESADDIVPTMINSLGIMIGDAGTPREELVKFLSQRQALLLVDNFEHVLDGADLLSDILQAASGVKILVTSREPLNIQEEWVRRVRGMPFPASVAVDDPITFNAVELFVNRARRVSGTLSFHHEQTHIVRICQLVEGLPLALELAASWLKTLTCAEVAEEIERSIDFLAANTRNLPERHRSMRAVFDHSWELCSAAEQQVFRRLCVFRAGFEREAAENVTGATLQVLSSLVEKSMLRKLPSGRYDIQELLRQFALEKLYEADEAEAIRDAHMRYYADFIQIRTPDIKGRRQLEGLNEIEADFENVRAAWLRTIEQVNYSLIDKLAEGLALFSDMRARYQDGINLFQKMFDGLARDNENANHPVFNRIAFYSAYVRILPTCDMSTNAMEHQLLDLIKIAQELDTSIMQGLCLWLFGEIERLKYELIDARKHYRKALEILENLDEPYYPGRILRGLAWCDIVDAPVENQQGLDLDRRHRETTLNNGDLTGYAHALHYESHNWDGDRERQILVEALRIWEEMGDWKSVGICQNYLAQIALLEWDFNRADELLSESQYLLEHCGWNDTGISILANGLKAMFTEDYQLAYDSISPFIYPLEVYQFKTYRDVLVKVLGLAMLGFLDPTASHQHIASALHLLNQQYHEVTAAGCLVVIAIVLKRDGQIVQATELMGLAYIYSDEYLMGWMHKWPLLLRTCDELQAELGTDAYDAAWERGEKRDINATVAEMLDYFGNSTDTTQPVEQPLAEPLTARELEVLSLLASGHSNRKIAEELTVVVGTIKTHIYNICQKLGADNRTPGCRHRTKSQDAIRAEI